MNGMSDDDKVKVVFIGGYGRSGSTLFDRMLGQVEGFVSVGELGNIWERSFGENQLCGCGKPFKACAFWGAIVEEAFGGFDKVDAQEVYALKRSVERMRYIPRLVFPHFRTPEYRKLLSEYTEILDRLYKAIRSVSGSTYVIDSTKDPPYGFVLSTLPGIELHVAHLVRDSRAVAYSWQRKKRRPEIHWKEEYMPKYSAIKSSWEWGLWNVLVHFLGFHASHYVLLRYENIVKQPRQALLDFLGKMGVLEVAPTQHFIDNRSLTLRVDHTVSGNPIRFTQGTIEVRPDTEWQHKLSASQRTLVTALTWPLLLKYKYPLRG